jgi:2,5-diketo-D-gluconate reductase B
MFDLSLSDGTAIPAVGFGTYKMKGKECTEAVGRALEVGYRHIDTAVYYQNHRDIAEAIRGVPRESLYLVSKLPSPDCHDETVVPAVQRILDELETDYLDLLLIHAPNRSIPFSETLGRMQECQQKGWVRSLGVSNFTTRHCTDAMESGVPFAVNQVEFHPYLYQKELLDFSKEHGILLTAYCPIIRGEAATDPTLVAIGKTYGKTGSQVALRWLLQHGLAVIPKTVTPARMVENIDLFDFELSGEEMVKIDALHKGYRLAHGEWTDFEYI